MYSEIYNTNYFLYSFYLILCFFLNVFLNFIVHLSARNRKETERISNEYLIMNTIATQLKIFPLKNNEEQ